MSGYSSKLLRVTLILPAGVFPGTSSNTLTLTGYRTLAHIKAAGGFSNTLDLTVYGMRQSDMNAVTILWGDATAAAMYGRPMVQVEASGDGGQSWCQVFEGNFVDGAPDYTAVPNVALRVLASIGYSAQIEAVPPTSYRGSTSVAAVATYIAGEMGFVLENNGVTGNLSTPYYPGTYMDQFRHLCQDMNLDFYFDGNAVLAICPKGKPRQGGSVPVFSPAMGNLVGFPTVQRFGVHADVLFTPALTIGNEFQIQGSIVPSANGTWFAGKMEHDLESLQPDGAWFTHIDCYRSAAQAAAAAG